MLHRQLIFQGWCRPSAAASVLSGRLHPLPARRPSLTETWPPRDPLPQPPCTPGRPDSMAAVPRACSRSPMEQQRSVLQQDASQGSTGAWVHRLALQQGQDSADSALPQSAEHALHRRAMLLRLPTRAGHFVGECTDIGSVSLRRQHPGVLHLLLSPLPGFGGRPLRSGTCWEGVDCQDAGSGCPGRVCPS